MDSSCAKKHRQKNIAKRLWVSLKDTWTGVLFARTGRQSKKDQQDLVWIILLVAIRVADNVRWAALGNVKTFQNLRFIVLFMRKDAQKRVDDCLVCANRKTVQEGPIRFSVDNPAGSY